MLWLERLVWGLYGEGLVKLLHFLVWGPLSSSLRTA